MFFSNPLASNIRWDLHVLDFLPLLLLLLAIISQKFVSIRGQQKFTIYLTKQPTFKSYQYYANKRDNRRTNK